MTVPALPAPQTTGTIAPLSWSNDARALFAYLRDTSPTVAVNESIMIATATTVAADFLTGATYDVEVGTWTHKTDRVGIPDAGRYLIAVFAEYASNATGFRRIIPYKWTAVTAGTKTEITGGRNTTFPGSASDTGIVAATTIATLAAGEALAVDLHQTSGSSIAVAWSMSATWLGA